MNISYSTASNYHHSFWISCGVKGYLGEAYKFKYLPREPTDIERAAPSNYYDKYTSGNKLLRQPKSNVDLLQQYLEIPNCSQDCLQLKLSGNLSVMFQEDILFYFITKLNDASDLIDISLVNGYGYDSTDSGGVNDVCVGNTTVETYDDASVCYRMILGAGSLMSQPFWEFCGVVIPSTAVVEFCVQDFTNCEVKSVFHASCPYNEIITTNLMYIVMTSLSAYGWANAYYEMSSGLLINDNQLGILFMIIDNIIIILKYDEFLYYC